MVRGEETHLLSQAAWAWTMASPKIQLEKMEAGREISRQINHVIDLPC